MKRILTILIAVLITGYLFFAVFITRVKKQDGVCRQLIVVIKDSVERNFIHEKDIVDLLKNAELYPVDLPVKDINTEFIKEHILNNELVANANVYKTPSGNIKIEITQKMPILRIFSGKESYYIDVMGSIMPSNYRYATYLPVANGHIEKLPAPTDLYEFALFLHKHPFWSKQIEQIYVHPNKEIELIPRVGNHCIVIGNFTDFREKMNKLQLFYEQAIPKLGWDKYKVINLSYKDQIVCTKK